MVRKYVVRLSDQEREHLREVVDRLSGSSQKVKRANVLLQSDADGPGWTDARIAEAYRCRVQTVENIRRRLVEYGFEVALEGKKRETPPTPKKLDGHQEAALIALRLGRPPSGFASWSLRLMARQLVVLELCDPSDPVSHELVRKTLKKTA